MGIWLHVDFVGACEVCTNRFLTMECTIYTVVSSEWLLQCKHLSEPVGVAI